MTIHSTTSLPGGVYSPPTGISKFDGTYDDTARTFAVTVKGLVEFGTPNGKAAWTGGRRATFMDSFRDGITNTWSQKFYLKNSADVRVLPTVTFASVANNQHMRVSVQAGVATPELAAFVTTSSGMNLFAAGLDVADGNLILRLDEGTVLPYNELIPPVTTETLNAHASQIEAYTTSLQRANAALPSGGGHIEFTKNVTTVDHTMRVKIGDAIRYTMQTYLMGQKRIPLEVTGYRNTDEGANVSMARANAVAAEIRTLGQFDAHMISAVDGGSKFFGHRYVKIRPLNLPQIMAKVQYTAAIHEFGHCIGLPDEYRLYPGMSVVGAHDAYRLLCDNNGLTPPRYPEKHDSIMSTGMRLYPAHYVTLLDCLKRITGDDTWRVDTAA